MAPGYPRVPPRRLVKLKSKANMTAMAEQSRSDEHINSHRATFQVSLHGSVAVIAVTGEVDASNTECLVGVLQRVRSEHTSIVVDLSRPEFLGTQALRALFDFDDQCRKGGVAWLLVSCHAVRRLLEIVGGGQSLSNAGCVDDAVRELLRAASRPHDDDIARVAAVKLRC
jgi:anti-anti-sigma factor